MDKVIIGIHGLANKPSADVLEESWLAALVEGIENRNQNRKTPPFIFRMVHWADLLYKYPLHSDRSFDFDDLYNQESYRPADRDNLKTYKESSFDHLRSTIIHVTGLFNEAIATGTAAPIDSHKVLRDLKFYYDENQKIKDRSGHLETARDVLDVQLVEAIVESHGADIMLIGHSMGSIIAYNVLRDLGQTNLGIEVSHFVTIGSPLGFSAVRGKIKKERKYAPVVRTPSVVTKSWVNFADKKDIVAVDTHLRDDYSANAGGVKVRDDLVCNDFRNQKNGRRNHHKSFGYLRTPELSDLVIDFLADGNNA